MAIKAKAYAVGVGLLTSSLASVLAYEVLDWALIRYWEWRHQGRRMMFTFWADFRSVLLAFLAFVWVLFATCRFVQRRSKDIPGE
jgi:hypothetical protein